LDCETEQADRLKQAFSFIYKIRKKQEKQKKDREEEREEKDKYTRRNRCKKIDLHDCSRLNKV
jgi:hypothetical protein